MRPAPSPPILARAQDASARVGVQIWVPLLRWGGGWAWRHRRELWAVWALSGAALLAEALHLLAGALWWLGLPVGALLLVGLLLLLSGEGDRRFARRAGGPALLWLTTAWAVGLGDPYVLLGLAGGGGLLCALWARRHLPRSRIVVTGGSWLWRREMRRSLRGVLEGWERTAAVSGIPDARLRLATADWEAGRTLHVELARGQVPKDIRPDRLASSIREFAFDLGPGDRPHEIVARERPEAAGVAELA